jgi:hypothetical protein
VEALFSELFSRNGNRPVHFAEGGWPEAENELVGALGCLCYVARGIGNVKHDLKFLVSPVLKRKSALQRLSAGAKRQVKAMGAYEDFDKLTEYSIYDLLKQPRREELLPDLAFKKGVTTLVGPSGGGKTTLTFCAAFLIDAGARWGGQVIEARPMKWIAGEGRDDLRPIHPRIIG